jgi:putative (di)nucleoside polyphosphate hydrolase
MQITTQMENPPSPLPYRPNVGIVVFNKDGLTLVGERLDHLGAWQYPQGGVDEGEDFAAAARRELHEETGILDAEFIYEAPDFLYYDFPATLKIERMTDRYRGQKQRWYLAWWDFPVAMANLKTHTQEFASVKFMPMAEATNQIVPFKHAIYEELERLFLPRIHDHLSAR